MTQTEGKPSIEAVRAHLQALQDHEVVLFGSVLTDHFSPRSDIDVAIITREPDAQVNREIWRQVLGTAPDRFDLRVFELLPLDIQHDIALHHEVVFGDSIELSYYFYRIHRLWDDVGPRIEANRFESVGERLGLTGMG